MTHIKEHKTTNCEIATEQIFQSRPQEGAGVLY